MTLPELVIDLREEHELLKGRIVSPDGHYEIVNIPSRHIFANVDWIRLQTEKRPVWLICASGRRSQSVKDQYFSRNDGIKSSNGGLKFVSDGTTAVDPAHITLQEGTGGLGIQQAMQVAFAIMLSAITISVFFGLKREFVLALCGVMLSAVLGQLITQSCLLGKIIPRNVFTPI